jgi:hypothetical protein
MAISDNGARTPSDPSPPPTPVPPSNTPSDSIMETPGLKETPRLPLDPEIHAVYCVQDMHTHPSCRATNNLSPPMFIMRLLRLLYRIDLRWCLRVNLFLSDFSVSSFSRLLLLVSSLQRRFLLVTYDEHASNGSIWIRLVQAVPTRVSSLLSARLFFSFLRLTFDEMSRRRNESNLLSFDPSGARRSNAGLNVQFGAILTKLWW